MNETPFYSPEPPPECICESIKGVRVSYRWYVEVTVEGEPRLFSMNQRMYEKLQPYLVPGAKITLEKCL